MTNINDKLVREVAERTGMAEKEVRSALNSIAYRKEYNKRPTVVEARKLYNRRHQADVRAGLELLRQKREAA